MKKRTRSTAAIVATEIRKTLRKDGIAAKVKSHNYAMGNAVYVTLYDPTSDNFKAVRELTEKYKAGNFDCMTDCYDYYSDRDDEKTVKHVVLSLDYSDELKDAARAKLEEVNYPEITYDTVSKLLLGNLPVSREFWSSYNPAK